MSAKFCAICLDIIRRYQKHALHRGAHVHLICLKARERNAWLCSGQIERDTPTEKAREGLSSPIERAIENALKEISETGNEDVRGVILSHVIDALAQGFASAISDANGNQEIEAALVKLWKDIFGVKYGPKP